MTQEKLLPQNVEAEASVLGSILIDPEAIVQITELLRPEDFYREAHRTIYQAALDLFETHEPADLITLADELARRDKLEEVGGISYVSSLANQVPTSRHIRHYAQIVQRTSVLRSLIHAAGHIAGVAYNEPDASTACEEALHAVLEVAARVEQHRETRDFADVLDELREEVLARMDMDTPPGIMTGFAGLDSLVQGIEPGELVYVAGRPGSGKSAFGRQSVVNATLDCARRGAGSVDMFTLEMSARAQARRQVATAASINTRLIRAGFRKGSLVDLEEHARFDQMVAQLQERLRGRLKIHSGVVSLAQVRARAMRAVQERGCRLLLIDQLDLMADTGKDEFQRITQMSRQLKQIAMSVGVAIICLVQLNREVEKRRNKRPQLSDLRQSGQLEQDADMVLGIFRPSYYDAANSDTQFQQFAEVLVLKVRDGESGVTIPLRYESEFTRFTDWPYEQWPADPTRGVSE